MTQRIRGEELRDELQRYPIGTRFKCVGHNLGGFYYQEQQVYEVAGGGFGNMLYPVNGIGLPGNGCSGVWELVSLPLKKELDEYM
jgi:hypothetical protein